MQSHHNAPKHFLSRSEFAAATTLSTRAVDNFIAEGTIKAVRLGRRVLIPLSELQRLEGESQSETA